MKFILNKRFLLCLTIILSITTTKTAQSTEDDNPIREINAHSSSNVAFGIDEYGNAEFFGQVKFNSDINVGGGLNVNGLLFCTVPIGTILDWWWPADKHPEANLPDKFALCNGQQVLDDKSPFYRKNLPDLNNQYVLGTTTYNEIGNRGGSSKLHINITTQDGGEHYHGFWGNQGTTDFISTRVGGVNQASDLYYMQNNEGNWLQSTWNADWGNQKLGQSQHRHNLPNTDSTPGHSHLINDNSTEIDPPHMQLLKIIRIK
jgi:hypothetical protein